MVAAGLLAGCGGGGGAGAGGASSTAVADASATASLDVIKSASSINSKGTDAITLTVVAKNAQNAIVPNQPVTASTSDAGARISPGSGRTDTNGQIVFTLQTSTPVNRAVPVSIQSGGIVAGTSVDVVGTTLSLNGPGAVIQGGKAAYTVSVRDSAGQPVAGVPVTVESALGNPVEPAAPRTDSNGQATVTVTAQAGQSDTLVVSASGAGASATLRVSPTNLVVTAGTGPSGEIDVNTDAAVSVMLLNNGAPVSGQAVQLTATRGALRDALVTVTNGAAGTIVRSASAGVSTIQATAADGTTGSARVEFVSRAPAKIAVQASPSIVGVNLPGSTQPQTSQLIAIVRDAADNPVKGATVNFSAVDPSGGSLAPPSAITDSSGIATAVFTPGASATGTDAIKITGTIPGTPYTGTASLTGSRRELSVSFGTGNEITKIDEVFNEVPYGVIVTDSAGNPVQNVRVVASLVPTPSPNVAYFKGAYSLVNNLWSATRRPCPNEDISRNLLLDSGEDINGNGRLDPRPSDAGTVYFENGIGTTDDKGTARLRVRYLRDRGGWVQVRLAVSATVVAGTEGFGYVDFILPVAASDLSNASASPPGQPSPFGSDITSCANPN